MLPSLSSTLNHIFRQPIRIFRTCTKVCVAALARLMRPLLLGLVAPNRARAATQSSVQTRTILIGCHFKIKLAKLCIDVTSYTSRATSAAIFEQYFKSHFQAANKNFPHLHESLCCRSRAADATTPILQNSTPPGTCACNFASRLGASDLERDERSLPHDVMSASNQPPPPEEPN